MKNKIAIITILLIASVAIAFNHLRAITISPDELTQLQGGNLGATVLQVYQGGTGAQTFTAGECLVGNGTGAITTTACAGGVWTDSGDYLEPTNGEAILFTPQTSPAHTEGLVYYDSTVKALTYYIDESDVALNIGQEMWHRVANDTGATITNGQMVYISGASTTAELPQITLAKADVHSTADKILGMATHNIEAGTIGVVTTQGEVRDLNTDSFSYGDILYLSADTAGGYTSTRPSYPNYVIRIGQVEIASTSGEIGVHTIGTVDDITVNSFNGIFLETINFTVATSGANIVGSLANASSTKNLTMRFSDGYTTLDTTPATTTILTAGSTTTPVTNYVYIPITTKALTVSTTDFPTDVEHIKVADLILRDAVTTATDGSLGNRNWNDHIAGVTDSIGHIQHIDERIRQLQAEYDSGVEPTLTITTNGGTPDNVDIAVTAGVVYQMHRQTFPVIDTGSGGDVHIVNHPTTAYVTVADLNTQLTDADGDSMSGRDFNLVLWGVQNRTGQNSHLMINLPTCSYSNTTDATNDVSNCDVTSIPPAFKGKGFLIARFTLEHSGGGGGTWTLEQTKDLRGVLPAAVGGGSTVTALVNFPDSSFTIYDNLDSTKIFNFQASGITTGNTRTLTVQDSDGTLAYTSDLASYFPLADWFATTTAPHLTTLSGLTTVGTIGTGVWNGTAIDFSDYTNATGGDAITITGDSINFDGGASPAGSLGGTWASPTVDSDGTWTLHNSYPSACSAGQYVTAIGDTLTCSTPAGGGATDQLGQIGDVATTTLDTGYTLAYTAGNDWQSTSTLVISPQQRVGIGSTSPEAVFVVDDGVTGTTTSQFGDTTNPFCMAVGGSDGTQYYLYINNSAWVIGTTDCNP